MPMTRFRCPDPKPPTDADIDTPAMIEDAAAIERGERHLRILAELADLGMQLVRAIVRDATSEPAASTNDETRKDGGKAAGEAPKAADSDRAYATVALAVRRTLALEAHLTKEVKTRGAGLQTQRAKRRGE